MAAGDFIVIGATSADTITKGSTLVRSVEWEDENGDPLDLSGVDLSIIEASPQAIATNGTITVTDSLAGTSELYIPAEVTAALAVGRFASFRLKARFSSASILVSQVITLEIT